MMNIKSGHKNPGGSCFGILGKLLIIFSIFTLIFIISAKSTAATDSGATFLIKRVIPDKAGNILFISGQKPSGKIKYNVVKLANPNRLVLDIENAVLMDEDGKISVKLNNSNLLDDIRVAQFSTVPKVVRIVFTAKNADVLDKVKITPYKNSVIIEFEKIALASSNTPSVYKDREKEKEEPLKEITLEKVVSSDKGEVLTEIKQKVPNNIIINNIRQIDNSITLTGVGVISVVEPFILDAPNRIIFDISDAVLDSTDLIQAIPLKNGDTARIAQFDAKTVRVVIESPNSEQYTEVISPDLQSVVIVPKSEISFVENPYSDSPGEIKDIKIIKDNDLTTEVILISEKPIIHSIKKLYNPNKIQLNLYNIKPSTNDSLKKLGKTAQFHGFEVDKTAWSIPLNRSTTVSTQLSLDGRVLKLTLQDDLTVPPLTAGGMKAKIVLDAGHGGYEPGAQYNGVYEKDITLDVTKKVKKYLENMGFYVIMTRETDKTVSLQERVEITNREKPDLFMSIHVNASNSPEIKGIETHWYTPQSKSYAMQVQAKMVNNIDTPDRGIKNSRFYVIRNTQVPAVLAEIGYMSNQVEMYQLMTDERRETTAKSIAEGILSYLKSKNPNNTDSSGRNKL